MDLGGWSFAPMAKLCASTLRSEEEYEEVTPVAKEVYDPRMQRGSIEACDVQNRQSRPSCPRCLGTHQRRGPFLPCGSQPSP